MPRPSCLTAGGRAGACTYFSSFGLNIFDIALAARLMRRAGAMGLGQPLTD